MVTTGQKTTPAPWVPFTRAGCDYGAVSTANIVLENTRTTTFGDMTKVFGAGSPEWNEAKASNAAPFGTAAGTIAQLPGSSFYRRLREKFGRLSR
jgi:hypothetical protein